MHPQSVAGALFSKDRKSILLIRRRDVPIWVLPGGGIDPGESPETAVVREMEEETGFTVQMERLVGDYIPINRLAKRTHLFECRVLQGEPKITEETSGIQFFPLSALPPLPPPYAEWIADAHIIRPPVTKELRSVNYFALVKNLALHPILVIRFLLSRIGLPCNWIKHESRLNRKKTG
ncbi:MAG: NUDIX domain-containing protein [Verrucomicrobia bacterium]|nr:NUDIX domain-containing protein [Verrucomicrobiota bacterium]MBU6447058.1 NUDIX domain-containing protein [Verrucomicrobiota bacterium]